MLNKIESSLEALRKAKPVVLCLTNYVTMDFVANSLLALGAAPIMSRDEREFKELVSICSAVYINIGTLDEASINCSHKAIKYAKEYNQPIILDPVGAGASLLRTKTAQEFMASADIIRGNASEIIALQDNAHNSKGVESVHQVSEAIKTAKKLAIDNNCVIAVSGVNDFITDGKQEKSLPFGSKLMPLITGMGCSLTATIAAFRAIIPNAFEATTLATAYFGLCGELAYFQAHKPASFRTAFIDNLYQPDWEKIDLLCDNKSNKITNKL
jgi:hydroxyethylthiazole kinase